MPQVKRYTAKRELRLDCGHTVKEGETYQVTTVFTCPQEGSWPRRILMACFAVLGRKQEGDAPAEPEQPQKAQAKPKARDASKA